MSHSCSTSIFMRIRVLIGSKIFQKKFGKYVFVLNRKSSIRQKKVFVDHATCSLKRCVFNSDFKTVTLELDHISSGRLFQRHDPEWAKT